MTSTESAQLTPRDVILEIGRNMHASCMPLISRIIVPSMYEVFLHPDDYHSQEPLFRLIREDAAIHLTSELEELNTPKNSKVASFFRTLAGQEKESLPYERDGSEWTIEFRMDPNNELPRGAVLVASRIRVPDSGGSGSKTRRILTERFSDEARTVHDEFGRAPTAPAGPGDTSRSLALLYYLDDAGVRRQFAMDRPEISIGRGGDGKWVDLQLPGSRSISKEHLLIRYDPATQKFEAQDVSTNGTSMDGVLLEPKTWKALRSTATFELAKGVKIEFKALR